MSKHSSQTITGLLLVSVARAEQQTRGTQHPPREEGQERKRARSVGEAACLRLNTQLTSGPWAGALPVTWPWHCPRQGLAFSQLLLS